VEVDPRRMCPNCRAFITTSDKICPYCDVPVGPRAIDRRSPADVWGLIPHARFTTFVILLINFGLYIAMMVLSSRLGMGAGFDMDGNILLAFGGKYGPAISGEGQWWRLITAGFLHGGLLHILMNSWAMFDLGAQVEQIYGTSRYVVFYIFTTVTGFLASLYWSPGLSIGASAGIFGLIGAMIAYGVRERSGFGDSVKSLYGRWAVYGLIFGFIGFTGTDNAAHLGGLAGGFVIGYVAGTPGLIQNAKEKAWNIAAIVAVAATGYAFVQMFLGLVRILNT
jgi:rhomboid protease GluP